MTEPDVRQEFLNLLYGNYPEIAKGHYVVLRRLQRDSNNEKIKCSCFDELGEVDKDIFCPICWGVGYLWTEEWLLTYSWYANRNDASNAFLNQILPPGMMDVPAKIFCAEYDCDIKEDDRIFEVSLNVEGNVITPVFREEAFKVIYSYPYRLDTGRIEYFKLFVHSEKLKYLNPPSYSNAE